MHLIKTKKNEIDQTVRNKTKFLDKYNKKEKLKNLSFIVKISGRMSCISADSTLLVFSRHRFRTSVEPMNPSDEPVCNLWG